MWYLYQNTLANKELQEMYNRLGDYRIIYSVLEYCDKRDLAVRKKHYFELYKSENYREVIIKSLKIKT